MCAALSWSELLTVSPVSVRYMIDLDMCRVFLMCNGSGAAIKCFVSVCVVMNQSGKLKVWWWYDLFCIFP